MFKTSVFLGSRITGDLNYLTTGQEKIWFSYVSGFRVSRFQMVNVPEYLPPIFCPSCSLPRPFRTTCSLQFSGQRSGPLPCLSGASTSPGSWTWARRHSSCFCPSLSCLPHLQVAAVVGAPLSPGPRSPDPKVCPDAGL